MVKTYYYDYGGCKNRSVTFTDSGCNYDHRTTDSQGQYWEYYKDTLSVSIPTPADIDLDIFYTYTYRWDSDWSGSGQYDNQIGTIVIPAGETGYTLDLTCQYESYTDNGSGGWIHEYYWIENIVFIDQPDIPDTCNPPSCHLQITGQTPTPPSQLGRNDGSIYATVTGNTGSTITWYINNAIQSGTTSGHTFSNLYAGTYYIKATEAGCSSQKTVVVYDGEFRTGDLTVSSPTDAGNIVAVENPVILDLSSGLNSVSPQYSVNVFTITGAISNVTIDFALVYPYVYNAEFKSKGYPDRSTYFVESITTNGVGVNVGTNTAEEIATSLAEVFQKDPIIPRLYYITSLNNTVTLTAKQYGGNYDLTPADVLISGSNLSLTTTTYGQARYDGQLIADYSLYTELFIDDSVEYGYPFALNTYKRVMELELPFSNTNIHQFDLSASLKNFVSSPKIAFTFTGFTYIGNWICAYYCKYGEKYPLVVASNTKKKRYKGQTDYGYCVNASLNFEDPNTMNQYFGVSGTSLTNVLFLNTAADTKYSQRDSKELMSFIIPKDYTFPLAVFADITLYDGTLYSGVKMFDITTSGSTGNFGGMAIIAVGYADLGLSSYETTSKIRKVSITVKQSYNSGVSYVDYSEKKSYLLEIDEQPTTYNVAFLNKLGTYETYGFTGELVESSDITRSSFQKPYPISDNGAAAIGFQYNSTIDSELTKTYTINTGIIDADTFYYLLGLLESNRIYHYDDIHQNYLVITNQTVNKSTNTNEYSLSITFKETISSNNVNF